MGEDCIIYANLISIVFLITAATINVDGNNMRTMATNPNYNPARNMLFSHPQKLRNTENGR